MKASQRRPVVLATLICFVLIASQAPSSAWFGPKPGDKCSVKGETKKIDGKNYICIQSKDGLLRWLINSTPSDKDAALGLVLDNCGQDLDGDYSVYIFPRMIFGAVIQKTIESGDFTPNVKSQSIFDYEINRSLGLTSNFEMASSLDSKWNKINKYWIAAIDSAYRRWQSGGVTQLEASIASESNLNSVESICKVAFKSGQSAANKEKRTVYNWILRVTSGY